MIFVEVPFAVNSSWSWNRRPRREATSGEKIKRISVVFRHRQRFWRRTRTIILRDEGAKATPISSKHSGIERPYAMRMANRGVAAFPLT